MSLALAPKVRSKRESTILIVSSILWNGSASGAHGTATHAGGGGSGGGIHLVTTYEG